MIYYGNTANEILKENLDNVNYNRCRGYFFDNNIWIAFDNTSGNCWVEEFKTEAIAICWLEQFFEISELEAFEVLKLQEDLLFIPDSNKLLKIYTYNDTISTQFYSFLHL